LRSQVHYDDPLKLKTPPLKPFGRALTGAPSECRWALPIRWPADWAL